MSIESTRHSREPETALEVLAAKIDAELHGVASEPRWRRRILPHLAACLADPVRTALQFYADSKNWRSPSTGFVAQYDPEPSPVETDHGFRAIVALQSLPSASASERVSAANAEPPSHPPSSEGSP